MSKDTNTLPNNQSYLPTIASNTTKIVDAIGQLRITGNIIPPLWFTHITYTTKAGKVKVNYLALHALSDLMYWYSPKIQRCEQTGQVKAVLKRFKEDKLQRSYKQYAKQFHTDNRIVKTAIDLLVDLGLVTREFRNILLESGRTLSNVMYLAPIPSAILFITHTPLLRKTVTPPPTKNRNTPPTKNRNMYTETIKYRENNNIIEGKKPLGSISDLSDIE